MVKVRVEVPPSALGALEVIGEFEFTRVPVRDELIRTPSGDFVVMVVCHYVGGEWADVASVVCRPAMAHPDAIDYKAAG